MGNSNAATPRQEPLLLFIIDLADELDLFPVDLRLKLFLKKFPFAPRYLGRDAQRHLGSVRNSNGGLRSFLGRQPTQEGEVRAGFEGRL